MDALGLKFLVRLCTDLGLKDAQEYIQKLKKAEKAREAKQQVLCVTRPTIIKHGNCLIFKPGACGAPVLLKSFLFVRQYACLCVCPQRH